MLHIFCRLFSIHYFINKLRCVVVRLYKIYGI